MGRKLLGILIPIGIQLGVAWMVMGVLPSRVATQFGLHGEPRSYMSPQVYFGFIAFEAVVLNVVFLGLAVAFEATRSIKWANIPNKAYWMSSPERIQAAALRVSRFLRVGAWGANAIVLGAQLLILGQNGVGVPFLIHPTLFVVVTFGASIAYFVWCLRLFRPTVKEGRDARPSRS